MKIYVYCGLNIADISFSCEFGRGVRQGLNPGGKVINGLNATSRKLPENGKHPKIYAEYLLKEIKWCKDNWDLHISTNSEVTVNFICALIDKEILNREDVFFYILSDDNSRIEIEVKYNEDGYLENWPYGFFDWEGDLK